MTPDGTPPDTAWIEDPELAAAVAEVEEFCASAGWDRAPALFALVSTVELLSAEPSLAGTLGSAPASPFTPIAQEALPAGDLSQALAQIAWSAEVAGCVLVQEIVVLPPSAVPAGGQDDIDPIVAAGHPERREGRLVAGVLRGRPGGACLLRMRDDESVALRGADLAPNLLAVLHATLAD